MSKTEQSHSGSNSFGLDLNFVKDVDLEVAVELGRAEITVADFIKWAKGTIVTLDHDQGAPVDIYANNNLVARGEPLVVNDNFGVRVTEIIGSNQLEEEE